MAFTVPVDNRVKIKEEQKIVKYQHLAREQKKKKIVEYESDFDTNCCWFFLNDPQRIGKN